MKTALNLTGITKFKYERKNEKDSFWHHRKYKLNALFDDWML